MLYFIILQWSDLGISTYVNMKNLMGLFLFHGTNCYHMRFIGYILFFLGNKV